MDINITHFIATAAPMDYSASVAEIGADAGLPFVYAVEVR